MKPVAITFFSGLIIISLCFYNIPAIGNNYLLAEPLFIGFTGLVLCCCLFKRILINKLEIFILLLLLYIFLRNLLLANKFNRELVVLFGIYLLYVITRNFISRLQKRKLNYYLLLYMAASIVVAIFILCLNSFNKPGITPFFPNKSIWGILLASQIVFVIPLLKDNINNRGGLLKIVFAVSTLLLLLHTDGRAGWLGLLTGICTILILKNKSKIIAGKVAIASICFILFLSFLLLFYKRDSSSGRLLIYKVSVIIIQKNLLFGVGFGKFKAVYNEYQADYFSAHDIDTKEALLADNTFYAFNDLLQFAAETGIAGLIIMGFIIFFLLQSIGRLIKPTTAHPLHIAAIASMTAILTASLFSYPLTVLPVMIQLIICIAIIIQTSQKETDFIVSRQFKMAHVAKYIVATCLFFYCYGLIIYNNAATAAKQLSRTAFKSKALEKYRLLSTSIYADGQLFFDYANELNYVNQLNEADSMLKISKQYFVTNGTYNLSASIKNEQNRFAEAEKNYLRAIYMVPDRVVPRYNLMEFYMQANKKEEAVYWGRSIMNMEVKIPSNQTQAIQQKVKKILGGISSYSE